MIMGTTAEGDAKPYTIQSLNEIPGILYEEIGTVAISKNTWSLVVHMDLLPISDREKIIKFYLRRLTKICAREVRADALCPALTDSVARMSKKIENGIETARDMIGTEKGYRRSRRGLIDGLGSIIKSITGNLDAADAEKFNNEIEAIRLRQKMTTDSMDRQIQIIASTIDVFNSTSRNIQENESLLKKLISQVEETLSNRVDEVMTRQQLDERITAIGMVVESLLGDVKELVDFLSGLSKGIIKPSVLSPRKIIQYLLQALPHLPSGQSFPTKLLNSEASNLMLVTDTHAYTQGSTLVIVLEIPLIGASDYVVSRVYPLPVSNENNTYYYSETTEDIVVVDRGFGTYIRITLNELEECKRMKNKYICNPKHPVIMIREDAPCEVLKYVKVDTDKCPKRVVNLENTMLITMKQPGRWIYIAPKSDPITVSCEDHQKVHEQLIGVGTLALTGKCTVTATTYKVETVRKITQEVYEIFVPPFNLSIPELKLEKLPGKSETVKLHRVISDPKELNTIGQQVRELQQGLKNQKRYDGHYIHTISTYSLSTIAPMACIAYVVYKCWKKNAVTRPATVPGQPAEAMPPVADPGQPVYARPTPARRIKFSFRRGARATTTM